MDMASSGQAVIYFSQGLPGFEELTRLFLCEREGLQPLTLLVALTGLSRSRWRPRYTDPMPPEPSFFWISQVQIRLPRKGSGAAFEEPALTGTPSGPIGWVGVSAATRVGLVDTGLLTRGSGSRCAADIISLQADTESAGSRFQRERRASIACWEKRR